MNKLKIPLTLFVVFHFLLLLPKTALPQIHLGQYEDEAPLRTWNTWGIPTGSGLAAGETQFAYAKDTNTALTNPALLTKLPELTITLNSSLTAASLFKFSLINTGVLSSPENTRLALYAIDFAGAAVNISGWAFAVTFGILEYYDRPKVDASYSIGSQLYYSLNYRQSGDLQNLNVALSRRIFSRLSLGLGINFAFGNMKKNIEEKWTETRVKITDDKSHDFTGFYVNGGLAWDITDKLTAGLLFRSGYEKKAESESAFRFLSPLGDTDIKIEAAEASNFKQPWVFGVGFHYQFTQSFRAASDISFFNWASYKIDYFGEEIDRNFRDIVKISAGMEYKTSVRIFGQNVNIPYRVGISYDPQPVTDPKSYYLYLTFGTGLNWGKFFLDAGALIGKENGSGHSLEGRKVALTLGFQI